MHWTKHGVGQLELVLPWKNLGSQSNVVIVEDLCLLYTAQIKVVYSKEMPEAKEQAYKKAAVEEHELARKMKSRERNRRRTKPL